jgi:hypothetical protein
MQFKPLGNRAKCQDFSSNGISPFAASVRFVNNGWAISASGALFASIQVGAGHLIEEIHS